VVVVDANIYLRIKKRCIEVYYKEGFIVGIIRIFYGCHIIIGKTTNLKRETLIEISLAILC
jgi:hypothetical protein